MLGGTLLRRFLENRRRAKQWHAEHEVAWRQALEKSGDGRTMFQIQVESIVGEILSSHGLKLLNRKVERRSEIFVTGEIPGHEMKFWIYEDQTEIRSPGLDLHLEQWDTKTPEEHYSVVSEYLSKILETVEHAT